jgi:ABC-type multidrug transport system fused ATPase/permease subunit
MKEGRGTDTAAVRRVLRRYWSVAGARPWHLALPLLLILLIGAVEGTSFGMLLPLSQAVADNSFAFLHESRVFGWIERLVPAALTDSPERDAYLTLVLIGLIVGGRVVKIFLEYARKVFQDLRNQRYQAAVKQETFGRVLRFGRQYFDRQALGKIDTEIGWSTAVVGLLVAVEGVVLNATRLAAKAVLMLALSVPLFLAIAVVFPVVQLILRRITKVAVRVSREAAGVERRMHAEVLDLLATIPLVKAFSLEERATSSYGEILTESLDIEVRRRRLYNLAYPVEETVILVAVLVVQGLTLWWTHDFSPGELARFAAFLLLVQQSLPDYKAISQLRLRFTEQVPQLEALAGLFDDDGKYIVPSGPRPFEGLREGITLRGLTFGYHPDVPVLRDVSARFPVGSVTALVGESGAGKSSLVDVVARFYDCPPRTLFFDDVDARELSLPSLHARLAMVSQDVWLLNRSLRANLAFGLDEKPPDERLVDALREVELGSLVDTLERGLDTEVGDRGVQLSGGQKQRLALARALLRDPEILVLDEATSALDSAVERQLEEVIERRTRGRTLIVIAHRLSTVRSADQILVLRAGRIVERGTWNDLLAQGGEFARLHRAQFGEPVTAREA